MKNHDKEPLRGQNGIKGFSTVELLIVVGMILAVAAFAVPNIILMVYNAQLSSAASNLAGFMHQARILAATQNPAAPYQIRYAVDQGAQEAYIDLNGNGILDAGEPVIVFPGTVTPAAGAPSGGDGTPSAYESNTDTGNGSYDNSYTLAFTPRGLPCMYDSTVAPAKCTTPAAKYFVHYLTDTRPVGQNGWAAVLVTTSGRTRTLRWDGAAWR